MTFENLPIRKDIQRALIEQGYTIPTPIQEQAIPVLMEGKDILGSAQTGTGKTAAFAIPILQSLSLKPKSKGIKALILAPTRELAAQIDESFKAYGKHLPLTSAVIFGGVSQGPQEQAVRRGVDILVATPGRLLDLIGQDIVNLSSISYFVLDEADRMLDMGFIHDVKKIMAHIPNERQTMLFSATIPKEILELSRSLLKNPVRVSVVPVEATLEIITQTLYKVKKPDKINLLSYLLSKDDVTSALVFTRTKHFANKLSKMLNQRGFTTEAIHGNKSQTARTQALANFKKSRTTVLVATDIAARGLDIEGLSHVVNFDLPEVPETYIHRIGRTGRAGFSGISISFQTPDEEKYLRDIEKHIGMKIPVGTYDQKDLDNVQSVRKETPPHTQETKTMDAATNDGTRSKRTRKKNNKERTEQTAPTPVSQNNTPKQASNQNGKRRQNARPQQERKTDKKPREEKKQNSDVRASTRIDNRGNNRSKGNRNQNQNVNSAKQTKPAEDLKAYSKDMEPVIDGKVIHKYNRHDFHYNRDALVKTKDNETK
jgi:ATP-dependent RNA helicase RhlE